MKFNDIFPSRFLKSEDLKGQDLVLTIAGVTMEEVGQERQMKAVLGFEKTDKCLVLNKTNGLTLASLHGNETDAWIGKRIALFPTRVPFGGKLVDTIRIRIKVPAASAADKDDGIPF